MSGSVGASGSRDEHASTNFLANARNDTSVSAGAVILRQARVVPEKGQSFMPPRKTGGTTIVRALNALRHTRTMRVWFTRLPARVTAAILMLYALKAVNTWCFDPRAA